MSYILDALKKAEKERDLGNVPKLETVHDSASATGRRTALWTVIGIGLLANAGVLTWWLWPERQPEPVATMALSEIPVVTAEPPQIASPAQTPPPAMTVPPQIPPAPTPQVQSPPVPAPQAAALPAPMEQTPPVPAPPPSAPAAASAMAELQPAAITAPPPATDAEVPLLRDMPDNIRGPLAGLSIDVHVYADTPAQRFVLVNMRKYHEGEQLAAGPLLELITPQGMVLRQHGQRFRIDR